MSTKIYIEVRITKNSFNLRYLDIDDVNQLSFHGFMTQILTEFKKLKYSFHRKLRHDPISIY